MKSAWPPERVMVAFGTAFTDARTRAPAQPFYHGLVRIALLHRAHDLQPRNFCERRLAPGAAILELSPIRGEQFSSPGTVPPNGRIYSIRAFQLRNSTSGDSKQPIGRVCSVKACYSFSYSPTGIPVSLDQLFFSLSARCYSPRSHQS